MRFSLLVIALTFTSHLALAKDDKIPFVPMSFCKTEETDLRAQWDKHRRVCFTSRGQVQSLVQFNGSVQSFLLTDLGEVKLRDKGQWESNDYVKSIQDSGDADLIKEIGSYNKYYVRYMSIAKPVNGVMPFMVSVFFSWGAFGHGTQTMYVFGEINKDGVRLTGFSTPDDYDTWYAGVSTKLDADIRAAYNTAANILSIFNGENPNTVGVKQTQDEDRARAQGVTAVVKKYRSTVQGEKTINTIRP